jgi:phosphoribosylformylglycinamidine synthase
VRNVRIGKSIELEVEGSDAATAKQRIAAMCEKLLVNPVIESYSVELLGEA